jgi:hypothetical protein
MGLPAVGLEHEALATPEEVGLDPPALDVESRVHLGSWEVGLLQEGKQTTLEVALRQF